MSEGEGRVQTRHPDPTKSVPAIEAWKYEAVRKAIRKAVPRKGEGLLFKDGRAITASDLAGRTRYPETIFHLAFTVLVEPEIDWLERVAGDEVILDAEYAKEAAGVP